MDRREISWGDLLAKKPTQHSAELEDAKRAGRPFAFCLKGEILAAETLRGLDLTAADFSGCELRSVIFDRCILSGAVFAGAKVHSGTFRHCNLSHADFRDVESLDQFNPGSLLFDNCSLERADFSRASLKKLRTVNPVADRRVSDIGSEFLKLKDARIEEAVFAGDTLAGADLSGAEFQSLDLRGADLQGCNFRGASIAGANLIGVDVDAQTSFHEAQVRDCEIERDALDNLGDPCGGLTLRQQRTLDIQNDDARLHFGFRGVLKWMHLCLLAAFTAPYIFILLSSLFLVRSRGNELFSTAASTEESFGVLNLFRLVKDFVYSGGGNWGVGPTKDFDLWFCALFALALVFNLARGWLLYQVKKLDFEKAVAGIRHPYHMGAVTQLAYTLSATKTATVAYILVVFFHGAHFWST